MIQLSNIACQFVDIVELLNQELGQELVNTLNSKSHLTASPYHPPLMDTLQMSIFGQLGKRQASESDEKMQTALMKGQPTITLQPFSR
jgi:hypothetical protein